MISDPFHRQPSTTKQMVWMMFFRLSVEARDFPSLFFHVFPNLAACQGGRDWPLHHPSTQTNSGFFMTHEANRTWAWTCLETWTHSRPPHYPWNSTTNPRGQECLPQPRALPSLAHQTTERRTAIGPPRPQPWAMAILETWQKEVDVAAVQKLGSSALRRVWVAIQCAIVRHTLRF